MGGSVSVILITAFVPFMFTDIHDMSVNEFLNSFSSAFVSIESLELPIFKFLSSQNFIIFSVSILLFPSISISQINDDIV